MPPAGRDSPVAEPGPVMSRVSRVAVPPLRIGIVPSATELRFRLTGAAGVIGPRVSRLDSGEYAIRLLRGSEAGMVPFWLIRVFRARRSADRCSSQMPGARVIEVGETYDAQGTAVRTVEHWVVSKEGHGRPDGWLTLGTGSIQAELVSVGRSLGHFERLAVSPDSGAVVTILDVLTGAGFHWEHGEDRRFRGRFEVVASPDGRLCFVNEVGLEEYLLSVATSEMRSSCPSDLLRAQTVAARSWVLARLGKVHLADPFDLCAEDHCQCYRGLERESSAGTAAARDTWGQVLVTRGRVCDARYAKVCGGLREGYGSVWGGSTPPYLRWGADADGGRLPGWDRGVRSEAAAAQWIAGRPPCYCNPDLSPEEPCVQEFGGYFRWRVAYAADELERLVNDRLDGKVGSVKEIRPLRRGRSGRIELLEIRGSRGTVRVRRELEIRRVLSKSHLPSSAFVCHQTRGGDGSQEKLVLEGAGWGHGVGMCQVGAAAMAHHGHDYRAILDHYYPGSRLVALCPAPPATWPDEAASDGRVPCWVYMNCYELRRCPVYLERSSEPCWQRDGSPRLGKGLLGYEQKQGHCRACPYLKACSRS